MKRIPLILLVLAVLAFPAWAQMMDSPMHGEGGAPEEGYPGWGGYGMMGPGYGGYGMGPGMMGPGYGGYGMGPGMMGPGYGGYGMGPGMMGPGYGGYGMGPGMMGPGYGGYGMGPGMMGPGYGGYGMGPGMMGPGYGGYGWQNNKESMKFLDATRGLRKELHMKMFDYMEMVRSGASEEKLKAAEKEIYKLRQSIYEKAKEMMK